jgi:hypothetical protein
LFDAYIVGDAAAYTVQTYPETIQFYSNWRMSDVSTETDFAFLDPIPDNFKLLNEDF